MASGPRWTPLGRIGRGDFEIGAVVGFAGGYVAAGNHRNRAAFWFSADGRSWEVGNLAQRVEDCSGDQVWDAHASGAASDGERIVMLGRRSFYPADVCQDPDEFFDGGLVAWSSTDGRNWTRSDMFAHRHAVMSRAWAIPGGGWEGISDSWDQPTAIWQSVDGRVWQQVASFPEMQGNSGAAGIDDHGTRLLVNQTDEGPVLLSSTDGQQWSPLSSGPQFRRSTDVMRIVPPRPLEAWLVAAYEPGGGTVLHRSTDLSSWERDDFPVARVLTSVLPSAAGYVVSAERIDRYEIACDGLPCPGPAERQYLSVDGREWTEIDGRIREGAIFAEGPAGVIGVGRYEGEVWMLER